MAQMTTDRTTSSKPPYRPETLRTHVDFARFYEEGAPFPATFANDPKAVERQF